MPSVVLEAFRSRVPVVAFDVGGVSEIVVPGSTGWLVNKGDNVGFVDAACEAIDNQAKRAHVTQAAYQLVVKDYSLIEIARQFEYIYQELLYVK
jgi:glycosyltransferase involved in cell wall biosynthesis